MNTIDDMNAMLERAWSRHIITGAQMASLHRMTCGLRERVAAYCAACQQHRAEWDIPAQHWPIAAAGGVQAWGAPAAADNVRRIVRDACRYTGATA